MKKTILFWFAFVVIPFGTADAVMCESDACSNGSLAKCSRSAITCTAHSTYVVCVYEDEVEVVSCPDAEEEEG